MNFVDEQHVVRFEVRQQRGKIARAFEHRARCLPQVDTHLARDDVSKRGLAETGRPEQQHVIERFGATLRGFDEDLELAAHFFLADVFVELSRPQRAFEHLLVRRGGRGGNDPLRGEFVGFNHAAIVPRAAARPTWPNGRLARRERRRDTAGTGAPLCLRQRLERELDPF